MTSTLDTRKPRRRFVLLGVFGSRNLGNNATLAVALEHIRRRAPEAEVVCVTNAPAAASREFDVPCIPMDPAPRSVLPYRIRSRLGWVGSLLDALATERARVAVCAEALKGADQCVVVGTGVLDDFAATPDGLPLALWRWCRASKIAGVPLTFLAVGAGPIRHPVSRTFMRRAVALSSRRSYRDTISRDFVQSLGIDTSRDPVVPDIVFGLANPGTPSMLRTAGSRTVGVGIMSYYGWRGDTSAGRKKYLLYIENMAWFVGWLRASGYAIRLLTGEVGSDDQAVQDVANRLDGSGASLSPLYATPISCFSDLISEVGACDFVVATRFHNLIAAMILGVPCISVGYAGKFDALMFEIGLGEYCQRTDSIDRSLLARQFESLVAREQLIRERIEVKVSQYRDVVDRHLDEVLAISVNFVRRSTVDAVNVR